MIKLEAIVQKKFFKKLMAVVKSVNQIKGFKLRRLKKKTQ